MRSGSAKRKGSSPKESTAKDGAAVDAAPPLSRFGSVGSAMVGLEDIERIIDRMIEPALVLDLGARRATRANASFFKLSGFGPSDLSDIDLARLFDLKDLEWILQVASKPQKERPVRSGVVCTGREERTFTSDVRVTVLAEKGGSLILLTYSPQPGTAVAARAGTGAAGTSKPVAPTRPAASAASGPEAWPAAEARRGAGSKGPIVSRGGEPGSGLPGTPAGEGLQAALTTFTRGLAATRDREMLGQVLIESSERLMGSGMVILVSRRAASKGAEVVLSTGLTGTALAAAHRWLDTLMVNAIVSSGRPVVLEVTSGEDAPGAGGEELAGAGAGALIVYPR